MMRTPKMEKLRIAEVASAESVSAPSSPQVELSEVELPDVPLMSSDSRRHACGSSMRFIAPDRRLTPWQKCLRLIEFITLSERGIDVELTKKGTLHPERPRCWGWKSTRYYRWSLGMGTDRWTNQFFGVQVSATLNSYVRNERVLRNRSPTSHAPTHIRDYS